MSDGEAQEEPGPKRRASGKGPTTVAKAPAAAAKARSRNAKKKKDDEKNDKKDANNDKKPADEDDDMNENADADDEGDKNNDGEGDSEPEEDFKLGKQQQKTKETLEDAVSILVFMDLNVDLQCSRSRRPSATRKSLTPLSTARRSPRAAVSGTLRRSCRPCQMRRTRTPILLLWTSHQR